MASVPPSEPNRVQPPFEPSVEPLPAEPSTPEPPETEPLSPDVDDPGHAPGEVPFPE